jgi:hypothetical protein
MHSSADPWARTRAPGAGLTGFPLEYAAASWLAYNHRVMMRLCAAGVLLMAAAVLIGKDQDAQRAWQTGEIRKVSETKRLIPGPERELPVSGQGSATGVTKRNAVYVVAVGTHVFVLKEELKGMAKPVDFPAAANVRFAIEGTGRACFLDPSGKEHKAQLADDTFDSPTPPRR